MRTFVNVAFRFEEIFMKKFLSLAFIATVLFVTPGSSFACPPVQTSGPEIDIELPATTTTEYKPVWVVDRDEKYKIRKFIWIPSEDGKTLLVIEASSDAILRLAWNLDTYNHGSTKTKTN